MRLVGLFGLVVLSLALAGAASGQAPAPAASAAGGLERTQQVGGWTVSDTGAKPGDDSGRMVRVARSLETVDFVLHRSDPDGAGLTIRFLRCDRLTVNSGFSLEGGVPARLAQLRDEIHDAFLDFAKRCPTRPGDGGAGEEAALLEGFDAAEALAETWIRERPFVYPPESAERK